MKKRINTTVDWTYIPCDMTDIYVGVTVNRGSLHDGHKKGIAHFLEHMLLCISDKDILNKKYNIRGTTYFDKTTYIISAENTFINFKDIIDLMIKIITGVYLSENNIENVRKDILKEFYETASTETIRFEKNFIKKSKITDYIPIGIEKDILDINFEDLFQFFNSAYNLKNMQLSILGGEDSWIYYIKKKLNAIDNNYMGEDKNYDSIGIVNTKLFYINKDANSRDGIYVYTNLYNLQKKADSYNRNIENIALYIIELAFSKKYTSNGLIIEIIRYSKQNKILRLKFQEKIYYDYFTELLLLELKYEIFEIFNIAMTSLMESLNTGFFGYQYIKHIMDCKLYGEEISTIHCITDFLELDRQFVYKDVLDYINMLRRRLWKIKKI